MKKSDNVLKLTGNDIFNLENEIKHFKENNLFRVTNTLRRKPEFIKSPKKVKNLIK